MGRRGIKNEEMNNNIRTPLSRFSGIDFESPTLYVSRMRIRGIKSERNGE